MKLMIEVLKKDYKTICKGDTLMLDSLVLRDNIYKAIQNGIPEKKGKWIEHQWAEEENGVLISNWECNLCKMWERKTSDFCPNCGAKMEDE